MEHLRPSIHANFRLVFCISCYFLNLKLLLRLALALSRETIPNQLGKPTNSPTLRWVFQCFMAVHLVSFHGVIQIVNLDNASSAYLKFLFSCLSTLLSSPYTCFLIVFGLPLRAECGFVRDLL